MRNIRYVRMRLLFILGVIFITSAVLLLNINVTTRQGVDYKVQIIKIPLYLKILNFFDRHYNYKRLAKEITSAAVTEEKRVMKIFEWSHANIRRVPEGFPVIDDHVWHTIIRGYGAADQVSDVFTTLCNYAGIEAFFFFLKTKDPLTKELPFSIVKITGKWRIFDPYHGVYFKDKQGGLIDLDGIRAKNKWSVYPKDRNPGIDYAGYLNNLPPIKEPGLSKPSIQSPLKRLFFELKKLKQ